MTYQEIQNIFNENNDIIPNGDNCSNYVAVTLKVDGETFSTDTGSISVTGIASESYY